MTVVDDLTTAVQQLISRAQTTPPSSNTSEELAQVKTELETVVKGVEDLINVINNIQISAPVSNMENQPEETEKVPS